VTTADTVVVFLWNDSSPFSSRLSGRRVSPRQLMDGLMDKVYHLHSWAPFNGQTMTLDVTE